MGVSLNQKDGAGIGARNRGAIKQASANGSIFPAADDCNGLDEGIIHDRLIPQRRLPPRRRFVEIMGGAGMGISRDDKPMRADIVREVAKILEDEVIIACVAMGYPDDNFAANAVRSDREAMTSSSATSVLPTDAERPEEIIPSRNFSCGLVTASCNLNRAGGTICGLKGLLLARGN